MDKKNTIKVCTTSSGAELNISAPSTKQVISATNNRAQYFAEQAKKYRDEAKTHRDSAKYYAEQNSDVTFEYIDKIRAALEDKISTKQNVDDYALKKELPENISELINDAEYVNKTELDEVRLPSQDGCAGRVLMSDGENESWVGISTFQLFDTVLKDHILTYEESKGWALQGTYVYKDAVAGSRYGYPDFYAKCLEEYNESTSEQAYLKSNVTSSEVVDNQGVLSGFSNNSSVILPESFNPDTNPFEILIKITTGSDVTTKQLIITRVDENITGLAFGIESGKFEWWLSSNGTSNDISKGAKGAYTVLVNTTYWVKVVWDGSTYSLSYSLDGTNFTQDITKESTLSIFGARKCLGNDDYSNSTPFLGTIDLNESYIEIGSERWWNGVTKYEYKTHSNGHKFFDIADKSSIDEIYNSTGMAWYYGIDTENERIFLPRNNWFEQASTSNVGQSVKAGLPNITGNIATIAAHGGYKAEGAFYDMGSYGDADYASVVGRRIGFNASRCSTIYGNSTTVQPNAVKKLLYICVGNTEVESVITDVVDVTTTDNDTIPLFTAQYFDFTPNNVSWLKAGEQANSGGIYTTCYNELVNELTNSKYNLKVIETSAMQSDEDYSEYWKINQDEESFTTPTAINVAEQSTIQLYFKVANAVENLELLDVGEVMESLSDKIGRQDCKAYITETYVNEASGYNVYSNGYCEQWGRVENPPSSGTVTMLKTFKDTKYCLVCQEGAKPTFEATDADTDGYGDTIGVTNFTINSFRYSIVATRAFNWRACGYIN